MKIVSLTAPLSATLIHSRSMTNDYTPGVKIPRTWGVKIQRAPTHTFLRISSSRSPVAIAPGSEVPPSPTQNRTDDVLPPPTDHVLSTLAERQGEWNRRSRCSGITGHVRSKIAVTLLRNHRSRSPGSTVTLVRNTQNRPVVGGRAQEKQTLSAPSPFSQRTCWCRPTRGPAASVSLPPFG